MSSSQTSAVDESGKSDTQFVDYTPPLEAKVLPPAKYKLWIIVFFLVYFASWAGDEAGLRQFLEFNGWLSYNASLLLNLTIVMFVMVYSTLDLLLAGLTYRTKSGEIYGIVAWLKQPRAQWVYRHENLFYDVSARVVNILEEGFAMFDAPQPPKVRHDHPRMFACKDGNCKTTLKIEHRIKPDRLEDYHRWEARIKKAVQQIEGVCVMKKESDVEMGTEAWPKDSPTLEVVYVTFENVDHLNDWILSPRRKALMKQLEPILALPDVVQIQKDRALPDAFSDLLTRQGNSVPKSPPRKWKVCWLTLLALYVSILWSASVLPYYFDVWGVSTIDSRLRRLIQLFIVTFMNSYVMTPLFLFLFGPWIQNDEVKNVREPWKTFDQGIESTGLKVALTVAYFGGCVASILLQKYAS